MKRSSAATWLAVAAVALPALACGGDTGGWAGAVRDSAGIAIVDNPADGLWRADERWRLEEGLRIGVADGDPIYQFGQITDLAVDPDGHVYVLDAQAQHVRVFDADGEHVRTIGAPGNGPGELSGTPTAVLMGPADTLLVADMGNQRVQRYLRDGTEAGSFPLSFNQGIAMKWISTPEGGAAYQLRSMAMPGMAQREGGDLLLVRGADGTVRDTLLTLDEGQSVRFENGRPDIVMFAAEPMWTLMPDGRLVSAITTDYRMEIHGSQGGIERVITRPFEPRSVTEADRQAVLSFLRNMMEDQGAPPNAVQMVVDGVRFADRYPAFANLLGGPDGTLWVQQVRSATSLPEEHAPSSMELEDMGSPDWDVFDADGRYLGVVTFPDRFRPLRWQGDRVYGVRRDDLDVPYVVRLRLVRPGGTG